jgi:hypothetical protein
MTVQYAEPVTTVKDINTKKILDILPPIQESPPARKPLDAIMTPAPIARPIDNHATPHVLPKVQQQIQETAQPYNPKPWYDGKPSGGTMGGVNTLSRRQLTAGQQNARDEAAAGIAYLLGYGLVGVYDGLTGQASDNTNLLFPRDGMEDAAYELGRNGGDLLRDSTIQTGRELRELRDNPPHFEIPQIKRPKLPQLPDFKVKIPEFKFPELKDKDKPIIEPKINKPKPVPKDLTRQLRELELSPCGGISFGILRAVKWLSPTNYIYMSLSELEAATKLYDADEYYLHYSDIKNLIEGAGSTGSRATKVLNQFTSYELPQLLGSGFIYDYEPYPHYRFLGRPVIVHGVNNKLAINAILDAEMMNGESIYYISVSNSAAKDCPIGKPSSPEPEPPSPPKKKMCCPEIDYRKIQAMINDAVDKLDLVAAIPMSWQIRNEGNRPQLVIQCAEENGVDKEGNKKYKSAMYPISVPHWDGTPSDKISLPSYIKGNYEGIYTLNDNSKVTINALNEIECKKILNAIKPRIPKQYTTDAYFKGGMIVRDKPIKESRVKARYGRYFKDGQKNNKPDWRVDFT